MEKPKKRWHDSTRLLHQGCDPEKSGGHPNTPLFLDIAPVMPSLAEARRRFAEAEAGMTYHRKGHDNAEVLENKLALMEGGEDALVFSTGMAATNCLLMEVVRRGWRVVCQPCVYGGTFGFLTKDLVDAGRHVRFVENPLNRDEWYREINHDLTAAVWLEMPSNPRIELVDLEAIAAICRAKKVLLIVDNTFAPLYFQPLAHGADLVVRSCTKYENPGNTNMLGAVIGPRAIISPMRNGRYERLGAPPSALDCWLTEIGLRFLALRMMVHSGNAEEVAFFLSGHQKVKRVYYPALPQSPHYQLHKRYLPKGCGAILSFELESPEACEKLLEPGALELFSHMITLGDIRSLITYPAASTHSKATPEMRARMGISDTLIRLSVGLEEAEDLVADLAQALNKI